MTMDVKTIREGGNNAAQVRLFGAVNYGTLTLKRGMTSNFDLWNWFESLYEAEANQSPAAMSPSRSLPRMASRRTCDFFSSAACR